MPIVLYNKEIDDAIYEQDKFDLLCEKNVIEQPPNVCRTSIVQNAWESGKELSIHGWIYSIKNRVLKNLGGLYQK